jgi:superfamily I DNA/RNA helicase
MGLGELLRENPEQYAVYEAAGKFSSIVVEALAGTGKTTTLIACGEKLKLENKRVLYLAFNSAIVRETKQKAMGLFDCFTAHGLAFRNMSPEMVNKFKATDGVFLLDREIAKLLEIPRTLYCHDFEFRKVSKDQFDSDLAYEAYIKKLEKKGDALKELPRGLLVELILSVVSSFMKSTHSEIADDFLYPEVDAALGWPWTVEGFGESEVLLNFIKKKAWDFWQRTISKDDLNFPLNHEAYLKLWQLSDPKLDYDVILFDEAQDADPVMLDIVQKQSAQVIWCGDSQQQIYGWRGALNTMKLVKRDREFTVATTRRFGSPIDQVANAFLIPLGSSKILPNPNHVSRVEFRDSEDESDQLAADLELFRTNASLLMRFVHLVEDGHEVRVIADLDKLEKLLLALLDLANGRPPLLRSIARFEDFGDLVDYLNIQNSRRRKNKYSSAPGWLPDANVLLNMAVPSKDGLFEWVSVERLHLGVWENLLIAIEKAKASSSSAKITLATAHRAKGLTADTVRVHSEFQIHSIYSGGRSISRATEIVKDQISTLMESEAEEFKEGIRLCYVAVTRARNLLIHPFNIEGINQEDGSLIEPLNQMQTSENSPEDHVTPLGGNEYADLPSWVGAVKEALVASQISLSAIEAMDYRIRFSGWMQREGMIENVEIDVVTNKANEPTVIQAKTENSRFLLSSIENTLKSEMAQRAEAVDELPELSKAAVVDLKKVEQSLLTEGKSIAWENGPHMWQVSVWEDNSPETRIIVPFGKRGVNRSHLVKWEGNEELARALWARFQMEEK